VVSLSSSALIVNVPLPLLIVIVPLVGEKYFAGLSTYPALGLITQYSKVPSVGALAVAVTVPVVVLLSVSLIVPGLNAKL